MCQHADLRRDFSDVYHYKVQDNGASGTVTISGPRPEISVTNMDVKLSNTEMWDRAQEYLDGRRPRPSFFSSMFGL